MISFILSYWFVLLYVFLVGLSFRYLKREEAISVASLGLGFLLYNWGRTSGKEEIVDEAKIVVKARKAAYEEIDRRNTSRNDVIDRLRDGSF